MNNSDILSAKRTIDKEIEALRMMEDELGDTLPQALDLMQSTKGRVIVTGMGKSGHVGSKIAATLASTGTPSFFVHPGEASHGDLGMLTKEDIVLAISNSGETKELSDIILYCKRYDIPLIAITKNPNSTLGKMGNILLKLPDDGEACPLGLAPTSSTTATMVLGDILAVCLLERRGFSKTDFRQRHPGGKLGSYLLKVSDLMHKDNEMPLVKTGTPLQTALLEMTSKMLGCVGIVSNDNKLIGIITDGDLRRKPCRRRRNIVLLRVHPREPLEHGGQICFVHIEMQHRREGEPAREHPPVRKVFVHKNEERIPVFCETRGREAVASRPVVEQ